MTRKFLGGLETVDICPYCSSDERSLAHKDVSDWSFDVAHGKWCYYKCEGCFSLYLSPRPNLLSIGEAYSNYYTHFSNTKVLNLSFLRLLVKNAWLSYLLDKKITPKLFVPQTLVRLISKLSGRDSLPFWIEPLEAMQPGKFLDMGCGSGTSLKIASQIGWDAMGIDFDESAVAETRRNGQKALVGSDELLDEYPKYFDVVLSSHVLEHVHDPLGFVTKMCSAVALNGVIIITLPNAKSFVRDYFGDNWRGLEAPRHLTLPSQQFLVEFISSLGFSVDIKSDDLAETVIESLRIQRRGKKSSFIDRIHAKFLTIERGKAPHSNDFIKLVCTKVD